MNRNAQWQDSDCFSWAVEPADQQVAEAVGAVANSAPLLDQEHYSEPSEQVPPGLSPCSDVFLRPGGLQRAARSLQRCRDLQGNFTPKAGIKVVSTPVFCACAAPCKRFSVFPFETSSLKIFQHCWPNVVWPNTVARIVILAMDCASISMIFGLWFSPAGNILLPLQDFCVV